jgi:hypothetical protein
VSKCWLILKVPGEYHNGPTALQCMARVGGPKWVDGLPDSASRYIGEVSAPDVKPSHVGFQMISIAFLCSAYSKSEAQYHDL